LPRGLGRGWVRRIWLDGSLGIGCAASVGIGSLKVRLGNVKARVGYVKEVLHLLTLDERLEVTVGRRRPIDCRVVLAGRESFVTDVPSG
jgi:hypothetical protein